MVVLKTSSCYHLGVERRRVLHGLELPVHDAVDVERGAGGGHGGAEPHRLRAPRLRGQLEASGVECADSGWGGS